MLENLVLEVQIWAVDDQILVIMKYHTVILNMTKKKKQPQAPPPPPLIKPQSLSSRLNFHFAI